MHNGATSTARAGTGHTETQPAAAGSAACAGRAGGTGGVRGTGGAGGTRGTGGAGIITADQWLAVQRRLGLSPQQRRIVQLIITEELKTDAIALRLGVKPSSVETQLHRLTRKLSVQTRVGVVVRVMWAMLGEGASNRGSEEE